jgi:hypothetical protein
MKTDTRKPLTQEAADAKAVIEHAFHGAPLDPEVTSRVRKRADEIREELRAKGLKNLAVDLIREHRDE